MQKRRIEKILYPIFIVSLLVSSFCLSTILLKVLTPLQSDVPLELGTTNIPETKPPAPPVSVNPPLRLEITSINVSTIVKPVGLTSEGDMAIDDNINDVAWYEPGPKPGENGSAVMAGHYGWKQGLASVFNNLHTLKAGNKIVVYDADNKPVSFIVQKTQSYDPAADATEVFQSSDGKAHLNLITCEGSWNSSQQTYSQRLVVFTDKEI